MRSMRVAVLIVMAATLLSAKDKERVWQTGTLINATNDSISRGKMVPNIIWDYSIDDGAGSIVVARRDMSSQYDKPLKLTVNKPVQYAIENMNVFVRDEDGKEHKFQLQKRVSKTDTPASSPGTAAAEAGVLHLTSVPAAAEITVDGNFMGTTPATIKLPAGKHEIRVSLEGWKEWSRSLQMTSGSELNMPVKLEKKP